MANTFGILFRVTTWGESHGKAIGAVVDGCPPRIPLTEADIQAQLDRRRPGQSSIVTPRAETDQVRILSGTFQGCTLGTPISLLIENKDFRPSDYSEMATKFRPPHADYTYQAKYGIRDWHGGGRTSARETVARVAAGAIARKVLHELYRVEIISYVVQVHHIKAHVDPETVELKLIESNPVRCPDPAAAKQMLEHIENIRDKGDTVGGIIETAVRGVPPGWGEPVFDRLEADLAKAMLSLPATKGFEIGSGFGSVDMTGTQHNDPFCIKAGRIGTVTNRSGGVQGGISNGEPIVFRVAFKPIATVKTEQDTVDAGGHPTRIKAKGRHDPCVLPRAVPIVEAMTALVLVDHALRHKAQCG